MIAPERAYALISGFEGIDGVQFGELVESGGISTPSGVELDLERDNAIAVRLRIGPRFSQSGNLYIILSRKILDLPPDALQEVGVGFADTVSERLQEKTGQPHG